MGHSDALARHRGLGEGRIAMTAGLWKDEAAWDQFVQERPAALNYHSWRWQRVIRETYGHEPAYLAATERGVITGVLPLFSIKSALFGKFLVSVPFFSYGGMLFDTPSATA